MAAALATAAAPRAVAAATDGVLASTVPLDRLRPAATLGHEYKIARTATSPAYWWLLKSAGTNSDTLSWRGGITFTGNVYRNGHEPITAAFQAILKPACAARPTCAVDAGMNAGFYALLFAAMGCYVAAYEVQDEYVQLATLSTRLNGFSDRIDIRNLAVGASTGGRAHIVNPEGGGGTKVASSKAEDATGLPIFSLDDLLEARWLRTAATCAGQAIAALKLDVEGFELNAFAGLRRALSQRRICNVIFEYGPKSRWALHRQTRVDGISTLNELWEYGYEIRLIHSFPPGSKLKVLLAHPNATRWAQVRASGYIYSRVPREELPMLTSVSSDVNLWAALPNEPSCQAYTPAAIHATTT